MIYGNISQLDKFPFLHPNIRKGLEFAASHNMASYEKGRHDICGDTIYFNIAEYTTAPAQEKQYEAHEAYIDIHYMIRGTERINVAFVSAMTQGIYEPEADYLPVDGRATASVIMKEGDFLICYPEDGHEPGIQVDAPMAIRKAIFKVAL